MNEVEIREQIKREAKKRLSPEDYALWETIKELFKEDKLKILVDILMDGGSLFGAYICNAIGYKSRRMRFLDIDQYYDLSGTWTSVALIPELIKFKPENMEINNKYGWFGILSSDSTDKRRQVLKDLIELIETTPEVERGQSNN
jgi:hypothetical protein